MYTKVDMEKLEGDFENSKKVLIALEDENQKHLILIWSIDVCGNDGLTSALIFFLWSLVFQAGAVLIRPIFFKIDGIWFFAVAMELVAAVMTILFIRAKKKKYHY